MRRRKQTPKIDRNDWMEAFQKGLGINSEELMAMSQTDFEIKVTYLESIDITPTKLPTQQSEEEIMNEIRGKMQDRARPRYVGPPTNLPHLSINQHDIQMNHQLKNEQDREYEAALLEAQRLEAESATIPVELEPVIIEEPQPDYPTMFQYLGPEPETGILIAAILPSNRRIQRRFPPDLRAESIYCWVGVQDDITGRPFKLYHPNGLLIEPRLNFGSQNIGDRSMVKAMFDQ